VVRLEGKIDQVLSRLEGITNENRSMLAEIKETGRSNRANLYAVAIGLALVIVAIAALFPVFFGIGDRIHEIIDKAVMDAVHPGNPPKQ
jgi:hypothetical protein